MTSTTTTGESPTIFDRLWNLRTAAEVEAFIDEQELNYRRVGDKNNTGTAEMVEKPENALIERETNMVDAVVMRKAIDKYGDLDTAKEKLPDDPRAAVEELVNLPAGAFDEAAQSEVTDLAKKAIIRIFKGSPDEDDRLTIDLLDEGIGQLPDDLPDTLLSLHSDNKNTIPFVIGNFGQGGSNSYPLCEYHIIMSRSHEGGDVGWTIVRVNTEHETDDGDIVRAYEYAVRPDGSIPRFDSSTAGPLANGGTLVRLVDFYATEFTGRADDKLNPNGVAGVTKKGLFASIYPVRVEDNRKESSPHATVKGGRHLLNDSKYIDEVDEQETQGTITVPTEYGDIDIRYWVVDPSQSDQDNDSKRDIIKRFVDPTNPIVWTRSGQVHHEESKRTIEGIDLGFVKDRIIVEIDADSLDKRYQAEVFSSTRDRVINSEVTDNIQNAIVEAIRTDEDLRRLNDHYHREARSGGDSAAEANEDLSDLMSNFDIEADDLPGEDVPGGEGRDDPYVPEPVSDRKPEPTWMEIDNPESADGETITVRQGGNFSLHLRLDANDDFEYNDPQFKISRDGDAGDALTRNSRRQLQNGHTYINFDVDDDADIGAEGGLEVECSWDDNNLEATTTIEIKEPYEHERDGGDDQAAGSVPPEIVPHMDNDGAAFSFGEKSVVKYIENDGERDEVHVALFNENIKPILDAVTRSEDTLNRYTREYMAHIAFQATMEHHSDVEWPDEELRNTVFNQSSIAMMQAIAKNVDPKAVA